MTRNVLLRRVLLGGLLVAVFVTGVVVGQKKNRFGTPTSVIHIVTLNWKADSTPEQRQKALEGVKTMAAEVPGIKNIWLKKMRSQMGQGKEWDQIIVIEFESEAAAKAYENHPGHKRWYEIYLPVREESRSHQVTNDAPAKK